MDNLFFESCKNNMQQQYKYMCEFHVFTFDQQERETE